MKKEDVLKPTNGNEILLETSSDTGVNEPWQRIYLWKVWCSRIANHNRKLTDARTFRMMMGQLTTIKRTCSPIWPQVGIMTQVCAAFDHSEGLTVVLTAIRSLQNFGIWRNSLEVWHTESQGLLFSGSILFYQNISQSALTTGALKG